MERIKPIGEKEREKVTIKAKSPPIPYEEVAELLRKGYDVFISNLPRRTAYYARKKLSILLGNEIHAWPATFERTAGYLFSTQGEVTGRRKLAKY